jgi:2Fe-2S ferredoxin
MARLTVLPHPQACPDGVTLEAPAGQSICEALLEHDVAIEHACEMSCACTTCHVIVRQGFASLIPSDEDEDDLLDQAWGLTPLSRLSCQARVGAIDLVIEIPRYSINHAREEH